MNTATKTQTGMTFTHIFSGTEWEVHVNGKAVFSARTEKQALEALADLERIWRNEIQ